MGSLGPPPRASTIGPRITQRTPPRLRTHIRSPRQLLVAHQAADVGSPANGDSATRRRSTMARLRGTEPHPRRESLHPRQAPIDLANDACENRLEVGHVQGRLEQVALQPHGQRRGHTESEAGVGGLDPRARLRDSANAALFGVGRDLTGRDTADLELAVRWRTCSAFMLIRVDHGRVGIRRRAGHGLAGVTYSV